MSTKPLSPDEVISIAIPDFVIRAVNAIIVKHYRGDYFTIKQGEIVDTILEHGSEHLTREEVFRNKYLDFEMLFQEYGWDISYDKPGWNETYEASFTFTPKKTKK